MWSYLEIGSLLQTWSRWSDAEVDPNPMADVLKRKQTHRDMQEEGHVKTGRVGAISSQIREHQI